MLLFPYSVFQVSGSALSLSTPTDPWSIACTENYNKSWALDYLTKLSSCSKNMILIKQPAFSYCQYKKNTYIRVASSSSCSFN